MTLTDEMLRQIMPNCPKAKRAECLPHLVSAMVEFNITNYLRASAFLATIAVESMEFRYFEEIASGAAYEGRRDLGNTQPGDGKKYKGRGVIQVTGRANSELCLKFLNLPAGQPELLAELSNAFRSAGWFWDPHRNLNPLADQRQFLTTQIRVNGKNKKTGLPNGWNERRSYYERALRILPEDLLVTDDGEAAGAVVAAAASTVTAAALADNADSDVHEATPLQQAAAEDSATVAQTTDESIADSSAAGATVLASDAAAPTVPTPVEGGAPTDTPVVVEAAMPAKERSTKSLVSTLTAGLGSVVLTIGALATKGAGWLKDNPELVVLFALAIVAIVVCYLLYQHRQTKLDLADRQHAKEVTLETMRIRSDPTLINVEVVPRAVPPEAPKG
jgi:predicted chitinase/heme/copper-type cytochrome/quinol oxidase subunit 4